MSRSNIECFAHESKTRFCSVSKIDIKEGTVDNLLGHFIQQSWGSKAALKERTVEIRLAYFKDEVMADVRAMRLVVILTLSNYGCFQTLTAYTPPGIGSKSWQSVASTARAPSSKTVLGVTLPNALEPPHATNTRDQDSTVNPGPSSQSVGLNLSVCANARLISAFQLRPIWTWDVQIHKCHFWRVTAEYEDSGEVLLTEGDSVDVIEIATDWQSGLELW